MGCVTAVLFDTKIFERFKFAIEFKTLDIEN